MTGTPCPHAVAPAARTPGPSPERERVSRARPPGTSARLETGLHPLLDAHPPCRRVPTAPEVTSGSVATTDGSPDVQRGTGVRPGGGVSTTETAIRGPGTGREVACAKDGTSSTPPRTLEEVIHLLYLSPVLRHHSPPLVSTPTETAILTLLLPEGSQQSGTGTAGGALLDGRPARSPSCRRASGHLRADVRRRFHRRRRHLVGHLPCRSTPSVVMFLIAQRYIVEGIATGGLKG